MYVRGSEGLKRCGRATGFEFQVYGCRGLRSPADLVAWTALILFLPLSVLLLLLLLLPLPAPPPPIKVQESVGVYA